MSVTPVHRGRRAWVSLIVASVFIAIALAAFIIIPSTINTGHTEVAPIPAVTSTPAPAPTATPTHAAAAFVVQNDVRPLGR